MIDLWSAASQVHDWVVYKLGTLLVVLQKPQPQANRLPPPRTLIMDYTMTHIRFGCSHLHPMDQLTNTRRSDGAPDPDVSLKDVTRIKIRRYRNLYLNHPDPIAFLPLAVDNTGRGPVSIPSRFVFR